MIPVGNRQPAFELQNVSFCYEQDVESTKSLTLKNLNCVFAAGSIVGVIGPNGSGKTSCS